MAGAARRRARFAGVAGLGSHRRPRLAHARGAFRAAARHCGFFGGRMVRRRRCPLGASDFCARRGSARGRVPLGRSRANRGRRNADVRCAVCLPDADDDYDRARAFLITLAFLLVTGALGAAFGLALEGRLNPQMLVALPQAHGVLGIAGWLTSLVFGVSARTMRAITGVVSRIAVAHVATSGLLLLGAVLFAIAMVTGAPATAGIVLMALGALFYAVDLIDIVSRRQHPNPVPQMFVVMADVWLVACVALGA